MKKNDKEKFIFGKKNFWRYEMVNCNYTHYEAKFDMQIVKDMLNSANCFCLEVIVTNLKTDKTKKYWKDTIYHEEEIEI